MNKRTYIKFLSVFITVSLLLTTLPGTAVQANAVPLTEEETFQLDADCQILDYVHADVFSQGNHVARLKEEETLDTYVFLNEDGTKTVYYMDEAVKFRDANGTVHEKNIDLTASLTGYSTTQNDVQLYIPNNISNGVQLSYAGYDVSIVPQGGSGRTLSPQRNGNSVAYINYYGSGTALIYTPTLNGVKEDILLAEYNGISDFTFLLNTDGLNLYHTPEDRYYLALAAEAEMKIWLGNIEIFDAEAKPSMGTVSVETVTAGQQYRLTISADVDFLKDPNTVYPVTIDPTITVSDNNGAGAIEDAPIYEGYPTSNFGTYQYNRVGYAGSAYKRARTVVRLTNLIHNSTYLSISSTDIQSVNFYIADASGTTASSVYLYSMPHSSWSESNITWNSAESFDNSDLFSTTSIGNGSYANFDITDLVKAWKNESYGSGENGFILVDYSENSVDRALYSCEHSTTTMRPYVVATYTINSGSMPSSIDVDEGDTYQLTVTGMGSAVTWRSLHPSIAKVDSSGVVTGVKAGAATIEASADGYTTKSCTVYVTIEDGVYYIKNLSSSKYLAADDGSISNQTDVIQETKSTADPDRLSQLWKIRHISSGYYSIRPMHKLDMGLNITSGNANIATIGTADSSSSIADSAQWRILYNSTGYRLTNKAVSNKSLYPSGGSTTTGASVVVANYSSTNTAFRWTLEKVTNVPNQIHMYNSETGLMNDNAVRVIRPGQTLTLAALGVDIGVTSCNSNTQSVTWRSDDSQIASVNPSTGTVTAGSAKCKATTITATSTLGVSTTYKICVTPITLEPQQTENWCWIASARMFTENYTTVELTQEEVALELGLVDNNHGGITEDIYMAIKEFSNYTLTNIGKTTNNTGRKILTKTALINTLNAGNVVCIGIEYTSTGNGHALVIVAHCETSDGDFFIIFDPGPPHEGSMHVVSYETICNGNFVYPTHLGSNHVWFGVVAVQTVFNDLSNWIEN